MAVQRDVTGRGRRRDDGGFSLVEVLVVLFIIGLLTALLLPSLRASRANAERVVCIEHLHQLGLALHMYANASGGWLPPWSGYHPVDEPVVPPSDPDAQRAWVETLGSYLSPESAVHHCPSYPVNTVYNDFMEAVWAGAHGRSSFKLSDVRTTARMVLSGDVTLPELYPHPFGTNANREDDADKDDAVSPCIAFPGAGGFLMHRGGNNVLFDDAHVDTFRTFDPVRMTFDPTRMASWADVKQGGGV